VFHKKNGKRRKPFAINYVKAKSISSGIEWQQPPKLISQFLAEA
jgi:hypothetical protein